MTSTESGTPFEPVYGPEDLGDFDAAGQLGAPGEFPYTRGPYASMYTARPWTMRQYAGFGTARESNQRYRELIAHGTTGLSVAFDLPTQMGYDSDSPVAAGEVGRVGVAIDSIEDMRLLFDQIPLGEVSTSMTINAPAAVLMLLYELVAAEQGVDPAQLTGTVQNDVLKEYIARGTYIYPPAASLRLVSDTFGYCAERLPRWNTISISGYHMAEAGANPAQEIGFTLANGIAYVQAALDAGLAVDDFAPRLSFFFVSRTTLLEEVAKFRAARRIWAHLMRDRFGAQNPKSLMLRVHTQTAGVQLTAQQPEVNMARVTIQALAAVLGGTQSLHTNSFDEAIALPTQKAARLALRTQQVIAYETDVTKTVDPFAGSYLMESLTDDVEAAARQLITAVDELGGAVAAIEEGFQKNEIERTAYQIAQQIDAGERVVVGVNRFTLETEEPYEPLRVDPAIEAEQAARLGRLRAERDSDAVSAALQRIRAAAVGTENVLYPLREALALRATVGEVCDALREVWGTYTPVGNVLILIDPHFVFLGAAFSITGSVRYAYLTLRGRTIPNRVTWFLWAVAPLIGFFAQLGDGVGLPAVLTLSIGVGPALIFVASFLNPSGFWRITRFDLGCAAISVVALVVWLALDSPSVAVIFAVLADLAGGIPTVLKSWRSPQTESPLVFSFAGVNGIITLLTIDRWEVSTWAFPAYITMLGTGMTLIVLLRRRAAV